MLIPLLDKALASRAPQLDAAHESAFRLFNGFSEGYPDLTLEIYGRTLVIHNYADEPNQIDFEEIVKYLPQLLNWLHVVIIKTRNGKTQQEKNGTLLFGEKPDTRVKEHGVWYAINLALNRDTSFYLDTCNLRKWLIENMRGKSVAGSSIAFGEYGLQALEPSWITSQQIEAARRAITRFIKRGGKLWIRVFPDKPVTKKPAETRMGKGKGAPDHWVAVVRPGKILFEMEGVTYQEASEAMRLASHKLPLRTKFVAREGAHS